MTGFIPRFAFWNPSTWAIPTLYWDTFSQEQRIHAICRQLGKVINYSDMLGVNVDEIASRLKAIEEGQLDPYIIAEIEQWFNDNEPFIVEQLNLLNTALPISEFDENATVKDGIDNLQTQIDVINGDNWVTTDRIDDGAVTFDKLDTYIQRMGTNIEQKLYYLYVDNTNGDDTTGKINDISKPYETLDAAMREVDRRGCDFRVRFLHGGDYTLTARVITGAVVHFDSTYSSTGNVHVKVVNDYGTFFAYDTHFNLQGKDNARMIFEVEPDNDDSTTIGLFEVEGSTLWCNWAKIICKRLYLIQGSARLASNTILEGRIDARFADVTGAGLFIQNYKPFNAIYAIQSSFRFEPFEDVGYSLMISDNGSVNGSTTCAIQAFNCVFNFNSTCFTENQVQSNYYRFFEGRGSTVYTSEANWESFKQYAQNMSLITSHGQLISSNLFLLSGTAAFSTVASGAYADISVDFECEMSSAPVVVASIYSTSGSVDMGNTTLVVHDITATGFMLRFYNNSATDKTPSVRWFAMH